MSTLKLQRQHLGIWWWFFCWVRGAAPAFGRLFGDLRLERRSGWVAENPVVVAHLERTLRPMDILLERSGFRLTDRMIPGFFTHAAVYLGRFADIGELLDEAQSERWLTPLQQGDGYVLEASRAGVRLLSLAQFLDVDELAVLRDTTLDAAELLSLARLALGQLGKAYNYNFDLCDKQRQFCSKLVAEVFAHRCFGDGTKSGPPTLLPDHIADAALGMQASLQPVFFSPCLMEGSPAHLRAALARALLPTNLS